MDSVTYRECVHCEAELGPRESYWVHHLSGHYRPLIFCERCVDPSRYALGLKAPATAPAGWGPAPMGSAKRRKRSAVKAERSEP